MWPPVRCGRQVAWIGLSRGRCQFMTEVLLVSADRSGWSDLAGLCEELCAAGAVVRVASGFDGRGLAELQVTEVRQLSMSLSGRSAGVRNRKPAVAWLRTCSRNALVRTAFRLSRGRPHAHGCWLGTTRGFGHAPGEWTLLSLPTRRLFERPARPHGSTRKR